MGRRRFSRTSAQCPHVGAFQFSLYISLTFWAEVPPLLNGGILKRLPPTLNSTNVFARNNVKAWEQTELHTVINSFLTSTTLNKSMSYVTNRGYPCRMWPTGDPSCQMWWTGDPLPKNFARKIHCWQMNLAQCSQQYLNICNWNCHILQWYSFTRNLTCVISSIAKSYGDI